VTFASRPIAHRGGRLWQCLAVMTILGSSHSLSAQGPGTGPHFAAQDFTGGARHRQLCTVTADCADRGEPGQFGTAPIGIGSFTFSPLSAPTLVLDDAGGLTGGNNPLDVSTSTSAGGQMWSANNTGVVPPGFYNFAALGPYCMTASGAEPGSAVVLDACAGAPGQAWDPVLIGKAYEFQPANGVNLCLTASAAGSGSAAVVDTCTGAPNQLWLLAVETNSSNTGKGGPAASPCNGIGDLSVAGVSYRPTWCQEFDGPARPPSTDAWNFDLGNNNGWGNGEAEVYCGPPGVLGNPSQCPATFSTTTAPVYIDGNGNLVIQPRNVNGTWISARLNTDGGQTFQYGIIEARIKLPDVSNQGVWPAFWGLGNNINSGVPWPTAGEVDILEDWSPQVYSGPGNTGEASTIHTYLTGGDGLSQRYTFPTGQAGNTAFHTYGIIWSPDQVQFFVDDPSKPFYTTTPASLASGDVWPFNQPIFLILNEAIGGTLGGSINGLTNPGPVTVDYVRWYTPREPRP
jgi:beta-glucanase (GH16 family)